MKRAILFVFLIAGYLSFAQYTAIPDNNFEAFLSTITLPDGVTPVDDIPGDNQVPTANAAQVTVLKLRNYGPTVTDLTGIEAFTALEQLDMIFHNLSSLDVSQNTELKNIWLNTNDRLTTLDFTNNTKLTSADLQSVDDLASLTFAETTLISFLDIRGTKLTEFDFTPHPNMSFFNAEGATLLETLNTKGTSATTVRTTGCTSLTCISVDNVADAIAGNGIYANWTEDNTAVYQFDKCYSTYVPDDNFEARLETLGLGNGIDNDDYVLTANITNVTSLYAGNQNISDATGIEAFTSLESLRIENNSLSSLDVSNLVNLKLLVCGGNVLTQLDVSNSPDLGVLECQFNQITSLDLSNNPALIFVRVNTNDLNDLNVQNGTNAQISIFTAQNNANLTCINVDDPTAGYLSSWTKDATAQFGERCDETYVPDDIFEAHLEANGMGNGVANDDYVTTANIENVTNLSLFNLGVQDLTGIEGFASITNLGAHNNNLTAADLSSNTNLVHIQLENNTNLTSIDLTGLTSLKRLWFSNTMVSSIDLSTNSSLEKLYVNDTGLTALNLSNNPDLDYLVCQNTGITALDLSNNPLIETVYASDCSISSINLENTTVLEILSLVGNDLTAIDLSNSISLRNLFLTTNQLTALDLKENPALFRVEIADNDLRLLDVRNGQNALIGIFDARANYNLDCLNVDDPTADYLTLWQVDTATFESHCNETYVPDNNFEDYLETHDANGNTVSIGDASSLGNGIANDDYVTTPMIEAVTNLNFGGQTRQAPVDISDLTGIEAFTALQILNCQGLQLVNLDLSSNTNLTEIYADNNDLAMLNVSGLTLLERLYVNNNLLTSLSLGTNTNLDFLFAAGNQIESLDLSSNPQLRAVVLTNNSLTELNVKNGANTSIITFLVNNNSDLSCVRVDDSAYSTTNWIGRDPQTGFSEACNAQLVAKVYLQGALLNPNTGEEGLMRDDLRTSSHLPTTSPYADGATCDASVFNTTGNNAIVDWIELELRDATNNTVVLEAKSALLQRDGDIVEVDGTTAFGFSSWAKSYYIVLKHRNHLGIMTQSSVSFGATAKNIDFWDINDISLFGTNAQTNFGMPTNTYAMWAGDANANGEVVFLNTGAESVNIKQTVLDVSTVESPFGASVFYKPSGYYNDDINMDGEVIFLNAGNELLYIKDNILVHPDNQIFNSVFYKIVQQLP